MRPGRATPYGHKKVVLGAARRDYRWVHRMVLEVFVGPPPPGRVARHVDGDPTNNRVENLAWGTPSQNNADMVAHGTSTRGERNARAKLTETQVREILQLRGVEIGTQVAPRYGVASATVYSIWSGKRWGWLSA